MAALVLKSSDVAGEIEPSEQSKLGKLQLRTHADA